MHVKVIVSQWSQNGGGWLPPQHSNSVFDNWNIMLPILVMWWLFMLCSLWYARYTSYCIMYIEQIFVVVAYHTIGY